MTVEEGRGIRRWVYVNNMVYDNKQRTRDKEITVYKIYKRKILNERRRGRSRGLCLKLFRPRS